MAENKTRQEIILLHGNTAFTTTNATDLALKKGELVIEHGAGAENVKLHTLDDNNAIATFVTEASVDAKVAVVAGDVEVLDGQVQALETTVGKAAEGDAPATGLVKAVADNASAIGELQAALGTGGSQENTLTSRIEDLEATVGDAENGLVKAVAVNTQAIEDLAGAHDQDLGEVNSALAELQATLTGYSSETTVKSAISALETTVGKAAEGDAEATGLVKAVADNASAIDGLGKRVESLEGDSEDYGNSITAIEEVLDGYTGKGSVAAAVAAAKTEVKKAEVAEGAKNYVTVTKTQDTDGHDVYSVLVDGVADLTAFEGLNEKVTTLIGNDANKSVRTIANEELAAQLLGEEKAEDNFKTLQELATWLENHPEDVAEMNAERAALEAALATFVTRTEDGALVAAETTVAKAISDLAGDIEDLGNDKVDASVYDAKMALLDQKDIDLNNAITAETQNRIVAISGVTESLAQEAEARGQLDDRVLAVETAYVTTVAVSGNDSIKATQSTDKHTWTLDFSALVVDGGTY